MIELCCPDTFLMGVCTLNKNIMKTEDDFYEYCPCASKLIRYADSVKTDARWFFDICYYEQFSNCYTAFFKSYITDEFKDYVLSLSATKTDTDWNIKIVKKVDGLQGDI